VTLGRLATYMIVVCQTKSDDPHAQSVILLEAKADNVEAVSMGKRMGMRMVPMDRVSFNHIRAPKENKIGLEHKGYWQLREILNEFVFPFVAKKGREAADGKQIFLITNREKLDWYNQHFNPALIQEHVAPKKELRVIVLNCHAAFGYWRHVIRGDSMNSSSRKGTWKTDDVDPKGVELAKIIAAEANLSDVAVDMVFDGSRYWVLELNFLWDETDSHQAGPDRITFVSEMIARGEL